MEFDKSRIYSAANADELKVGSKVIVADTLEDLRNKIETGEHEFTLCNIEDENSEYRFHVDNNNVFNDDIFALAYLVSEPEKLKWTDLKIGDAITDGEIECMVVSIDKNPSSIFRICVITADGNDWLSDKDLKEWEKIDK